MMICICVGGDFMPYTLEYNFDDSHFTLCIPHFAFPISRFIILKRFADILYYTLQPSSFFLER